MNCSCLHPCSFVGYTTELRNYEEYKKSAYLFLVKIDIFLPALIPQRWSLPTVLYILIGYWNFKYFWSVVLKIWRKTFTPSHRGPILFFFFYNFKILLSHTTYKKKYISVNCEESTKKKKWPLTNIIAVNCDKWLLRAINTYYHVRA